MPKRILTIQDISCVGQCSLTVALPVISACGIETAILPSAVLSTHTAGFRDFTFRDLTDDMKAICRHWVSEKIRFDAFYTGYLCSSQIEPIMEIMEKCAVPGALRIIDPVMGDNGSLYAGFKPDFPDRMATLCRGADCILPNLTEAALLLHEPCCLDGYDREYIETTIRRLAALGAKTVLLTGVSFQPDLLGIAVFDGNEVTYHFNEKIPRIAHGTGDIFASVVTGALMRGVPLKEAGKLAADIVCAAIRTTEESHWYGVRFETVLPELVRRLAQLV